MVKELQDRKKLSEGRNYGMGFSILKPLDNGDFETYNAFTACKDYLNDLVFVENYKKEIYKAHGYKHKLQNIFDDKEYFYLAIGPINYSSGKNYEDYDKLLKLLYNNKNYISTINNIEDKFNIKNKTEIVKKDKITYKNGEIGDVLVLKAPIYWVKYPHLISLYTILLRTLVNVRKNANLINKKKCFISSDNYLYTNISKKLFKLKSFDILLEHYDYKKEYENSQSNGDAYNIHNKGIKTWLNELPHDKFKK